MYIKKVSNSAIIIFIFVPYYPKKYVVCSTMINELIRLINIFMTSDNENLVLCKCILQYIDKNHTCVLCSCVLVKMMIHKSPDTMIEYWL